MRVEGSKDDPSKPEENSSEKHHEDGTKGFEGGHGVVVVLKGEVVEPRSVVEFTRGQSTGGGSDKSARSLQVSSEFGLVIGRLDLDRATPVGCADPAAGTVQGCGVNSGHGV